MEWQHIVIQQVCSGDWRLGFIEFRLSRFGLGVDVESTLRAKVSVKLRVDLAPGLVIQFLLLQYLNAAIFHGTKVAVKCVMRQANDLAGL